MSNLISNQSAINFCKIKNMLILSENDGLPIFGQEALNVLMRKDNSHKTDDVFFCFISPEQKTSLESYINSFSRPEERDFLNDYVKWRTNSPSDNFSYSPVRVDAALHHLEKIDMFLTYKY